MLKLFNIYNVSIFCLRLVPVFMFIGCDFAMALDVTQTAVSHDSKTFVILESMGNAYGLFTVVCVVTTGMVVAAMPIIPV